MFRVIASPATVVATTVDSSTYRQQCARGFAISGDATNNDVREAPSPALGGFRTASSNLSDLAHKGNDMSIQMSLGFQVRNNPRLRSVHGGGDRSHGGGGGGGMAENVFSNISKALRRIGDALAPTEYDTLNLRRGGWADVPRGHSPSEREWAELDAGRKVTFNPRIGATLIPTVEEVYPTPAHTAACFFSARERAKESRCISSGEGLAEWAALREEIRQEAEEGQEKETKARLRRELQQQKAERLESRNFLGALGAFFA